MNILLLGKNGQVGQELSRSLLPLGTLTTLGQSDLDLSDSHALIHVLESLKPQLIINAAAYTAVDKAEVETIKAFAINATSVGIIANYTKKKDGLFVHYSTDYVFNGEKKRPYVETDDPDPLNVYGASKLAGEQAILNSGCHHLIFRTSWVYSPLGHNFIKTILKLALHKESLTVVDDQYGAPTAAEFIADVTAHAIIAYQQERLPDGLYHLTANGATSWYHLACYAIDKAKKNGIDLTLEPSKIQPILSAAYPLPAERPKNSTLDSTRLSNNLDLILPDWSVYVDKMIDQLIQMRFFLWDEKVLF